MQQATSNKQQATSNKQQATSNKQQATSNKQQATSNKQQATSNKQQATSNKQQATSNKASLMGLVILFLLLAACDSPVEVLPKKPNTEAKITVFNFAGNAGNVDQTKDEISFGKSFDYDDWKNKLTASDVKYSDNATLSFDPKTTATDYTIVGKRQITVTAEDRVTTKTYKIKVQIKVTDMNRFDVVYKEIQRMGGVIGGAVFNGDLNHLDTSQVSTMKAMFSHTKSLHPDRDIGKTFNGNISQWDVDKVTSMSSMFSGASSFNQSLNDWDVDNVTDMSGMFSGAFSFNQSLNDWDVAKVTNMSGMFSEAFSFNQSLNDWDVDNVTDMSGMFYTAVSFNGNISTWTVNKVISMNYMFGYAHSFNGNISDWTIDNDTNTIYMFRRATALTSANKPTIMIRFCEERDVSEEDCFS